MPAEQRSKQRNFRRDINGLRAWAVIAVLLYHYDIAIFRGGFIGVDVFFVISGFLMTGIILRKLDAGTFSLAGFYLARGRRILPALAFMCLALIVFGWFWLAPHHYEIIGKHAGASILFFSNLIYDRAGGYFATPANENWLLHTWSLSVEWQFYLTYPLLLMAATRFGNNPRRNLLHTLIAISVASLIYGIYKTGTDPVSGFFILPVRAWELVAGGLVYLYSAKLVLDRKAEYLGLLLVIASILLFDDSTEWPGYLAMIPVAGTCLVIFSAKQESIWTSNRLAQAIGRWSYSIYLWHWPLVVGLRYFGVIEDLRWVATAMTASILMGALSYRFIEQTGASIMGRQGARNAWLYFAASIAVTFLVAAIPYYGEGVAQPWRLPESALIAAYEKHNKGMLSKCNTRTSNCVLGKGDTLAVVWGDSHAIATVSAVAETAVNAGGGIRFYGQQSCPVIFDAISSNPFDRHYCRDFNDMVLSELETIDENIPVIIINRAGFYMEPGAGQMFFTDSADSPVADKRKIFLAHMAESLCRIAAARRVYLVMPIPVMPVDVPEAMSKSLIIHDRPLSPSVSRAAHAASSAEIAEAMQGIAADCGVRLLDPAQYLCDDTTCRGDIDGRPLYSDDNHLSEFGNRLLIPMYQAVFNDPPAPLHGRR
ncbi:MAG: acyltransferase [Gammaproteobacteria bacterium]|nr:acyltransferase [Gammaproteobacteria bacterium]